MTDGPAPIRQKNTTSARGAAYYNSGGMGSPIGSGMGLVCVGGCFVLLVLGLSNLASIN